MAALLLTICTPAHVLPAPLLLIRLAVILLKKPKR
jgi:hypothetical protein